LWVNAAEKATIFKLLAGRGQSEARQVIGSDYVGIAASDRFRAYNSQNRLCMPFTLSHPAAIIPFARQRLVLSALVVGSMSPDFLYFINLAPRGEFGHTLAGVFLFCLPLGMLTLWLFHALMKWPLLSLFPQALQERLMGPAQGFAFGAMGRQLLIVLSLLIGAGTHLLWDGFTHEYGWAVSRLSFLSRSVIETGAQSIPVFKLLQHLSTVIGGGALLYCFLHWMWRAPQEEVKESIQRPARSKLICVSLLLVSSISLGLLSSWWKVTPPDQQRGLSVWLGAFVVSVHSGLFVELVLFGLYWHFTGKLEVIRKDAKLGKGARDI
jgi:uncharacterized protein DUF4184